uniref:G-protein coupled receptors family 1 profile domain-containing protein n=1 Tax=Plectus sambesii TaxID=2011161 RepID=A0A914VUU7_9BILA
MVISQIATLSLAVDRMNTFRDPIGYYKKEHFQSAMYWWGAAGSLGIATAAMPQIANDIDTIIHYFEPTWPTWFRRYWMIFSIVISTLVILAYLLVIVFSRKMNSNLGKNEDSRANERKAVREKMVIKMVVRVLTVYVLTWGLPSLVYNVTVLFNVSLGTAFGLLMMFGSVLCSCGNVVILLMREDIRAELKSLLWCYFSQQQESSSGTTSGKLNIALNVFRVDSA